MIGLGLVSLVAGAVAILNPFLASLAVEAMAGAAFLIVGIGTLWMAISGQPEGAKNRLFNGAIGLTMVLFGLSLLFFPIAGLVSLTIFVGAFFLAEGIVRLIVAFRMRDRAGWGWLAAGGAVSALLGLLILLALPGAALGLLGLFLGVDLIASGVGLIAMGFACRKAA